LSPPSNRENHGLLVQAIVDAVARAIIYFEFVDTLPHGAIFPEIAEPDPIKPDADLLAGCDILDPLQPLFKRFLSRFSEVILSCVGEAFHLEQCSIKATNTQELFYL
jgi:hypothetical protein